MQFGLLDRQIAALNSFFSVLAAPVAYGVPGPGIRYEQQLQPRILNLLCQARDQICVPVLQRHCH